MYQTRSAHHKEPMIMEKPSVHEPLLPSAYPKPAPASHKKSIALLLSLFSLITLLSPSPLAFFSRRGRTSNAAAQSTLKPSCAQAEPLMPSKGIFNVSSVWEHKDRIIKWHQGAIKVPTQVYDGMGEPGEDERWDIFGEFHEYLEESYPLVHKHLTRTKLDTWGLVFEWFGSDESLQPIFLAAHQDVVPVLPDTVYQWDQPPFGAIYDGEYIWGRGSSDDKSGLTSIMAAIELLLETSKFTPTRTVILGFGHDEEGGSSRGAAAIRDWLLNKYGKDSMAILIDEGSGISKSWGQTFGLVSVAEKGKFDLNMTISTLGGHSSVPPVHTNIGLTALLVAQLEKHPHPVRLRKTSPVWGFLQCSAAYASTMPSALKKEVMKSEKGDAKAFKSLPEILIVEGMGPNWVGPGMGNPTRALLTTTQATDLIYGGVKVNALPEVVTVVVNHRIDVASSVEELHEQIFATLLPTVKEYKLSLDGFGRSFTPTEKAAGHVSLTGAFGDNTLNPAPISPTDMGSAAWRLLAGTSRGMWASRPEVSTNGEIVELAVGDDLVMAPFMATGNTDTNRYWDFTRNIYRWRYVSDDGNQGAHTINERVSADAMVEFVRFYQAFILNADASKEL
ncbi:putative carboxypeptidase s precursor [Naematelia encephala]|uniref:Putative carboxypeptidase s n=1 Tax=Naematelia encephala TaxID=71784 RepID=A0A1Y2B5Q2_9TREE|nr:putative carboxypeptidase s precursor [Naematelia encephala]